MSPERLEEIKRTLSRIAEESQFSTLEYFEASWEAWCQRILASANVPPYGRPVRLHADGTWTDDLPTDWPKSLGDVPRPSTIVSPLALIERRDGRTSKAWHAYDILQLIHGLRHARTKQDIDRALEAQYGLFTSVLTAMLNFGLEADARRGKQVREGANKGGKARTRDYQARWQQEYAAWQQMGDRLHDQHPQLSKNAIAKQVGREFNKSPHTVRKRLTFPSHRFPTREES